MRIYSIVLVVSLLYIQTVSLEQIVTEGTSVVLNCPLPGLPDYPAWSGPPSLSTELTNEGDNANPSAPRMSWANDYDLMITGVEAGDAGEYQCSYTGLGDHTITLVVTTAVTTTPANIQESVDIHVGSTATLRCALPGLSGYPAWSGPPNLSTQLSTEDDSAINSAAPISSRLSWDGYNLKLAAVESGDAGEYQCAYGDLGIHSTTLDVNTEPTDGGGLSTGALVGIVIGLLVVLCCMLVGIIFVRRFLSR